jgi:hypothetical protein
MQQRRRLTLRLAAGLLSLALVGGWAASARADIAYAFASQTISNINVVPGSGALNPGPFTVTTQDGATQDGSGPSRSDTFDVAQTYLPANGSPQAPENTFTRWAPGNPPVSNQTTPSTSFTRGDAQVTPNPFTLGTNTASNVAESFLNTTSSQGVTRETGIGGFIVSFNVTPSAGTPLAISYNFSNALAVFQTGIGTASGSYLFNVTVKDAAGNVVFNSNTGNTNLSAATPPNSFTPATGFKTGSETVTTPTLTAGALYSIAISGTEQTAVAVPEPGVVTLVAASGGLTLAVGAVRRRALRGARK